jgi:hypothetical protein
MSVMGNLQEMHKMNSQRGGLQYRLIKFICQAHEIVSIKFYISDQWRVFKFTVIRI